MCSSIPSSFPGRSDHNATGHALAQGDAGVLDVDDKVPAHFGHDGDLSALYKTQAFQEAAGFVLTVVTVPEGAIVNGMITTTSLKK